MKCRKDRKLILIFWDGIFRNGRKKILINTLEWVLNLESLFCILKKEAKIRDSHSSLEKKLKYSSPIITLGIPINVSSVYIFFPLDINIPYFLIPSLKQVFFMKLSAHSGTLGLLIGKQIKRILSENKINKKLTKIPR